VQVFRTRIAAEIVDFIWQDIVYYYRIFGQLIIDENLKNKKIIVIFAQKYNIKKIQISIYNSKITEIIKQGHRDFLNELLKINNSKKK
jgi:hypothetical protein